MLSYVNSVDDVPRRPRAVACAARADPAPTAALIRTDESDTHTVPSAFEGAKVAAGDAELVPKRAPRMVAVTAPVTGLFVLTAALAKTVSKDSGAAIELRRDRTVRAAGDNGA